MLLGKLHVIDILDILLSFFVATASSCDKDTFDIDLSPESAIQSPDTTIIYLKPKDDPKLEPVDLEGEVLVTTYAELGYKHQSAAVYGDYAFFVRDHRSGIRLFDLNRKSHVYTLTLKGDNSYVYHCNQSTFGVDRYVPEDFFPLLYISQRDRSEKRCLTEVYRIIPLFSADSTSLLAFRTELVQEIFFPPMTAENSMGNVNCVIDDKAGWLYTYSRNNNKEDDNYGKCKISRFAIPDVHQEAVYLEDSDITSSFMIDVSAINMQGGCIVDGRLFIGQGYPAVQYVYLNVVDLRQERLVKRYDFLSRGVDWEPEGCFYYDGNVMIAHTDAICRIEEED